jgi:hypothetical protein
MRVRFKHAKGMFVVIAGLAALALSVPAPLSASGGTAYSTSDCDRAIEYLGCTSGTTCTAKTCTGESGTLYPCELSCVNAQ